MFENLQYDVRESARARNITLKVNRNDGLVVVVPRHFDHELLPAILSSRQAWITQQLERFDVRPGRFEADWPPRSLDLQGIGRTHRIDYQPWSQPRLRLRQSADKVVVQMTADASDEQIAALLVRWLKQVARQYLPLRVEELSQRSGMQYSKVVIRGQKTRWGSYSSRGTVSLNYKLLFLPERLLLYVIAHELVHSIHMNHSDAFWEALQRVDPRARVHDQELSSGWEYLPAWAV